MKKIAVIVTTILIIASGALLIVIMLNRQAHAARSESEAIDRPEWTLAYSRYVNSSGINLMIDDLNLISERKVYMDNNGALMIDRDIVRDAFGCSVKLYDNSILRIAKGRIVVRAEVGSNTVTVSKLYSEDESEEEIALSASCIFRGQELYIPAEILVNAIGYDYTWENSTSTAIFLSDDPDIENLTSYFSYADIGDIWYVRNQGDLGSCWAFAAMAAMEYSLKPEEDWDFSEDHMIHNSPYSMLDFGGDYLMATAYLTSWSGPVREEDDPYNDGMTDSTLAAVKHVQEVRFLKDGDLTEIKKMIFRYGVIESSLYIGMNEDSTYLDPESYDPQTCSYIYTGSEAPNHEIVIIGWDDDYPQEYFMGKADRDGAFICKNSWGSAFGDNGVFYVSYCDVRIGQVCICYTRIEDPDNYDCIYQADRAGWVGLIGYGRNKAYMANVYTAQGSESLEAVGFYATDRNTSYRVYVCSDFKDSSSLDVSGKVYAQGTLKDAGYYTVDLSEPVILGGGQKFAVIVEIITPSQTKPVAIEITTSSVYAETEGNESYLSSYGDSWECLQDNESGNICLKAYTRKR